MYENNSRGNVRTLLPTIIKVAIIAVVIILVALIIGSTARSTASTTISGDVDTMYRENINTMKDAGFEYFTTSNLPEKVGGTEELSLEEMFNRKMLIDFTNSGETCNLTNSYIKATKTSDLNYALKVQLNCGETSDYIVTTIEKVEACVVDCNEDDDKDVEVNNNNTDDSKDNSTASNNTSSNNNSSSNNSTTHEVIVKNEVYYHYKLELPCLENCTTDDDSDKDDDKDEDEVVWEYEYRKKEYVEYYDYCKSSDKWYYTTGWIASNYGFNRSYEYTLRLEDMGGAVNVALADESYFSNSNTDYSRYITTRDDYITMTNPVEDTFYNAYGFTTTVFRNSSLKSNNFTFDVSGVYDIGDEYYVDITINYKNSYGVTPYYFSKVGYNILLVPLKFEVTYSQEDDCVTDLRTNQNKYVGYSVSNPTSEYEYVYEYFTKDKVPSGWYATGDKRIQE